MWTPSDLLTDLDLLALDRLCLTDFGVSALTDKRAVAAEWIRQRVEQAGYRPHQHAIRHAADAVVGFTGSTYTDYTAAAADTTDLDLPLSSILSTPASCALYVGFREPFKGVWVGMVDALNSQSAVASLTVWTGAWTGVTSLTDGTIATSGKSFSKGGLVTCQQPDAWSRRTLNNSLLYWARVQVSASLTAATAAAQLTPILPSRLTLPAAHYALGLLYQESYGAQRGAWSEKATSMFEQAKAALDVALPLIADEFDVDDSDAITRPEVSSVTAALGPTIWERG